MSNFAYMLCLLLVGLSASAIGGFAVLRFLNWFGPRDSISKWLVAAAVCSTVMLLSLALAVSGFAYVAHNWR